MKEFPTAVLCIFLFLAYTGLRIGNFSAVAGGRVFPDTKGYVTKASWPLWSWGDRLGPLGGISTWVLRGRPLTVPLFYKIAGNVPHKITAVQLGLSIVAWALLAWFVARAVDTHLLQPIAFLIVLLFSLSDQIIMWDALLLSDSIAISLLAFFVASWLWLFENWHWHKAVLVITVGFLWTFSRDTNAWVALMLAGFLVVIGALQRCPRYLLMAAAFVSIFIANEISQNYAKRWVTPFANVIGKRILPDPEKTVYFSQLGMPVTPAVMRFSGQLAWSQQRAFYNDPELRELREWVYTDGKAAYITFMLTHPAMTLLDPFRNIEDLIAPRLNYYRSAQFFPILEGVLADIIYLDNWPTLVPAASGIMLLIAGVAMIQKRNKAWLVAALLVVLAYPHCLVAWHGDANDVGRHALPAGVHLRLGLWLLLIFLADMMSLRKNRNDRDCFSPLTGATKK